MNKLNPFYYIGANPTVDLVLINEKNQVLFVLRKENAVEGGKWALPGGFINGHHSTNITFIPDETAEEAAKRETMEETQLCVEQPLYFVGIFEGNQRDPRDNEASWSQSHAFVCPTKEEFYKHQTIMADGIEVSSVKWISINELNSYKIAFDHLKIIALAQEKLISLKNYKKSNFV